MIPQNQKDNSRHYKRGDVIELDDGTMRLTSLSALAANAARADCKRETAERIVFTIRRARGVFTEEGVGVWLFGANKMLGGRTALDAIETGDYAALEALFDQ